jgi:PPOX class probable F420-dependent enzyme
VAPGDAEQKLVAARPGARPVPGRRLPAALFSARMATRSAPAGLRTIADAPRTGSVEQVARHKRALLTTFRRNGTPVPTPVWAALADGRLYLRSERVSGKLKRLRNDARVLVAPCTVRGKPLGAPFEAHARALAASEEPLAEAHSRAPLRARPRAVRGLDGPAARRHVLPRDHAWGVGAGSGACQP